MFHERRKTYRMDNMPITLQIQDRFGVVVRSIIVYRNSSEHYNVWNDFVADAHYRNHQFARDKERCPFRVWGMGPTGAERSNDAKS